MYNFVTIDFEPAIRHTIATLISQYQKYLSPLKGYSCPHRLLYGNESCSQYVKQTILEQDLRTALYMSRQRFRQCSLAGQELVRLAVESNKSSCNDCCSNSETNECLCLQCCCIDSKIRNDCKNCVERFSSPEGIKVCAETCEVCSSPKKILKECCTCGEVENMLRIINLYKLRIFIYTILVYLPI